MIWLAPSEKDTDTAALEERLWGAAEQAVPAPISGLKSQEYSGGRPQGPVLGLIFLRFTELRFAAQRARLEKAAHRLVIGILLWASTVLPVMAASGLFTDERGELRLRDTPFHGVGVNYYDAFTRTLRWKKDTREQFAEMLAADNPSPMTTLCVRGYDLTTDIERLAQAMTVAQAVKKPLFVGEFGAPGASTAESKEKFATILAAIETNRVPLSALWVFDFASQAKDWNVTATNHRSWQLEAVQEANERIGATR